MCPSQCVHLILNYSGGQIEFYQQKGLTHCANCRNNGTSANLCWGTEAASVPRGKNTLHPRSGGNTSQIPQYISNPRLFAIEKQPSLCLEAFVHVLLLAQIPKQVDGTTANEGPDLCSVKLFIFRWRFKLLKFAVRLSQRGWNELIYSDCQIFALKHWNEL